MTYQIYTYSTLGASLTYEILQDIGYTVLRKGSMYPSSQDWKVGMFNVDLESKLAKYFEVELTSANKLAMEQGLNARTAFRATEFIRKYQQQNA